MVLERSAEMATKAFILAFTAPPAVARTIHHLISEIRDKRGSFAVDEAWPAMESYRIHHRVEHTNAGLEVIPLDYHPERIPDELKVVVADAIAALSVPVVGWPDRALSLGSFAKGEEIDLLEASIGKLADVQLHGQRPKLETTVHYQTVRDDAEGRRLVFDVRLRASTSVDVKGVKWISEIDASGELLTRASDGAFVDLKLQGPGREWASATVRTKEQGTSPKEAKMCSLGNFELHASLGPCHNFHPAQGSTSAGRMVTDQ